MHDLDTTLGEFEEEFEYADEAEFYDESEMESPFSEEEEIDLTYELMSVTDEAELDMFLGKLIKRAGRFLRSPVGRRLKGMFKRLARRALPVAGRALGTWIGGPAGGAVGRRLASTAGRYFGLELEGLAPEDQEFEVTRRFVRMVGTAAKKAASAPATANPQTVAKKAAVTAALKHAPGLVKRPSASPIGRSRSGRWIRRGRKIVVMGV